MRKEIYTEVISAKITKEKKEQLDKLALKKSLEAGHRIYISELVRDLVDEGLKTIN